MGKLYDDILEGFNEIAEMTNNDELKDKVTKIKKVDNQKLLNEDWKNYVDVFGEDYDPSQFVNKIEKVSSTQHDIFDFLYDSFVFQNG